MHSHLPISKKKKNDQSLFFAIFNLKLIWFFQKILAKNKTIVKVSQGKDPLLKGKPCGIVRKRKCQPQNYYALTIGKK